MTILEQHFLLSRAHMILALGDNVGYSFIGGQSICQWGDVFKQQWKDPLCYEIISFHHEAGVHIPNATTTGNGMVLLPLGDDVNPLAVAERRLENIYLAQIKVDLDFDTLVEDYEWPLYYPTYTGPDNICTVSAETFLQDILPDTRQAAPFNLNDHAYGRTFADVDELKLNDTFIEKIIVVAWPTINNTLSNVTWPNTVNKPSASLEAIT